MAPRNRRGSMVRNTRLEGSNFSGRAQRVAKTRRGRLFRGKKATVSSLSRIGPVSTVVYASLLLQNLSQRRFNENLRTFNWI